MTKRKKGKGLARGQRRAEKARRRQQRKARESSASPDYEGDDDLARLFSTSDGRSGRMTAEVRGLVEVVMDSDWLAEEPELADIMFDPIESVNCLLALADEQGMDPGHLSESPKEEVAEDYFSLLTDSVAELLTEEMRREILDDLEEAAERMAREGRDEDATKTRLLSSFLDRFGAGVSWNAAGFMQAIMHRSVQMGFELAEAAEKALLSTSERPGKRSLWQRVREAPAVARFAEAMSRLTVDEAELDRRASEIWDEGIEALHRGELLLWLYSPEEIMQAMQPLTKAFLSAKQGEPGAAEFELSPEQTEALREEMASILTGILTPEWLVQARGGIASLLATSEIPSRWFPFISVVLNVMANAEAEDYKDLYYSALMGEVMHAVRRMAGSPEEEASPEGDEASHEEGE